MASHAKILSLPYTTAATHTVQEAFQLGLCTSTVVKALESRAAKQSTERPKPRSLVIVSRPSGKNACFFLHKGFCSKPGLLEKGGQLGVCIWGAWGLSGSGLVQQA